MSDVTVGDEAGAVKRVKKAVKKAAAKKKVVAKKKATAAPKKTGVTVVHHKVLVDGKEYGSVFKAFDALKLPLGSHASFRAKLKASGSETYETERGKKLKFKLVK